MKRIVRWLLATVVGVALVPAAAMAQATGTVQGTVVDAGTQAPLSGVQVSVEGAGLGTLTDAQGRFQILNVPTGQQTVDAQLIGYREAQQTVDVPGGGAVTANFTLEEEAVTLEGVVVTALGIEQEERAVSTSVSEISGDELADVPEPNLVSALSGQAAGVNVISGGPQGGSARIVIRGNSSIEGNNQPLFVVDGVPIDNSAPRNYGYGGIDYGNTTQDINPNDIASITVLKGPAAAALYGSRAANGVVQITTKSGRGLSEPQITYNSNVSWQTPLKLPEYQNQYGQGLFGEFEFVDGAGAGTYDFVDESWGPACDGQPIPQFFSEVVNGVRQADPFLCYPENVSGFFETGTTITNNLSFATASDQANVRLSVSNLRQDAMYPGQELGRTTVALAGGAQVTDRLRAEGSVNYIVTEGENRTGTGYNGSNPMLQYIWFGRSVSTEMLRDYKLEDTPLGVGGTAYNWNYNYHGNPYWIAFENQNWDERNRIIGNVSLDYQFTPWLNATLRTGRDWYRDDRKRTWAAGFIDYPEGRFEQDNIFRSETNTDFLLNADRDLTSAVSMSLTAGASRRDNEYDFNYVEVAQLSEPGIYTVDNAATPPVNVDVIERERINSLYGAARFGFQNYLFLDVTGRNDWSSTLPDENNSYFYPSVSGSFIFTDALPLNWGPLSYGKLRASWAQVGNDADPYQLTSVFIQGTPWSGIPTYTAPNVIPNPELRPEQTEGWEIGTELGFLNDRLGLEVTYYDEVTRDQILPVQISAASGFTEQVVNAGAISNKGWEVLLNAVPVDLDNGLRWEATANYATNDNAVEELYGDLTSVILAGGSGTYWGVTNEARVGEPYGTLRGTTYVRDDAGNIVVGTNGLPQIGPVGVLGNYAADWTGSLSNRLSYGGLGFSFQLHTRQGGEIFSVTNMFGRYTGVLDETLRGREEGPCEPGIIVDGVKEDGTPNDIVVCPQNYFGWIGYPLKEPNVFDASYVKLREARLEYTLPGSWMERTPFSRMTVALVGRNLFLWDEIPHIDPESAFDASNVQGFEFGQLPSPRSFGFNITIQP